jgi:glycosyltransferase involved in cell wall biosynthesis
MQKHQKAKVIFFEAGSSGGSVNRLITILKNWDFDDIPAGLFALYNEKKAAELLNCKGTLFSVSLNLKNVKLPDPIRKQFSLLYIPTLFGMTYFKTSYLILKRERPAIVYLNNTAYPHTPVILAAWLLKIPIICHLRDTIQFTFIEKLLIKVTTKFIALSKAAKVHYVNQGIPADKISVVYDSIDFKQFKSDQGRDYTKTADQVVAVVVGSLLQRKGQDVVIKALKKVTEKHHNAKLQLLGDGQDRNNLEELTHSLGLTQNVEFVGFTDNVTAYLHNADIGILASRREGMPNSVMEYMSLGLPVIVTDLPGIDEIIVDGESGFIIPQEADGQLADKWIALLEHAELRKLLGTNAYNIQLNHKFSIVEEIQRIKKVIKNSCKGC